MLTQIRYGIFWARMKDAGRPEQTIFQENG
jgi:hypothetical protein